MNRAVRVLTAVVEYTRDCLTIGAETLGALVYRSPVPETVFAPRPISDLDTRPPCFWINHDLNKIATLSRDFPFRPTSGFEGSPNDVPTS